MKTNMGNADRLIRILVALLVTILYFTGMINGALGIALLVLAAIFLLTAFVGVCPLYMPFGISTRRK